MVLPLRYDDIVGIYVFVDDVIPFRRATNAGPLANGVERQAVVLSQAFSIIKPNEISRLSWKVSIDKLLEIALADKANAITVPLFRRGQRCFFRKFSNFRFVHLADRKQDIFQCPGGDAAKKVALIFPLVFSRQLHRFPRGGTGA